MPLAEVIEWLFDHRVPQAETFALAQKLVRAGYDSKTTLAAMSREQAKKVCSGKLLTKLTKALAVKPEDIAVEDELELYDPV